MRIDLINESHTVILVDESLRKRTINEDVMDIIDDAIEAVFGTAGLVPIVGDIVGDVPMIIKNIIQKDWIGAAIFTISLIPEAGDVAKILRVIQKAAKYTGQTDRLNKFIEYLYKQSPQGKLIDYMMSLFNKAVEKLYTILDKGIDAKDKAKDDKSVRNTRVIAKIKEFVENNVNEMEKHFEAFIKKIENKHEQNANPIAGTDFPTKYIDDYASAIKNTYLKLDHKNRIAYLKKLKQNANRRPEVMMAYNKVFWDASK